MMTNKIKHVPFLPDLMTPEDKDNRDGKKIRIRIKATDNGVDILGDSMYVKELEALLKKLEAPEIEMVLCG
jgi:hypothetical protein